MLKLTSLALPLALLSIASAAFAVTPEEAASMSDDELQAAYMEEIYGATKEQTQLRAADQKGLKLANNFRTGKGSEPTKGPAGAVVFIYGAAQPRVICRPLRVTDIALQPGEKVCGVPLVGDSTNWEVLPGTSGPDDHVIVHVMVKPAMPDLATNLTIHTDRRTYLIELVSTNGKGYYPYISFSYPGWQSEEAWSQLDTRLKRIAAERELREKEAQDAAATAPKQSALYKFSGRSTVSWYPLGAYDDGQHVYIFLPQGIKGQEMPVFQTMRGKTREVANYRPMANGQGLIVDNLFKQGVLTVGKDNVYITVKTVDPFAQDTDKKK